MKLHPESPTFTEEQRKKYNIPEWGHAVLRKYPKKEGESENLAIVP